jgi:hypothetical protein
MDDNKFTDFQTALTLLKRQRTIKRISWPAHLVLSESNSIYVIDEVTGEYALWQPTQKDLLAVDWVISTGGHSNG